MQKTPFGRPQIRAHAFQILSALALISVGMHVVNKRKTVEMERNQIEARRSILEDVTSRIRKQEALDVQEVDRLLRLAGGVTVDGNTSTPVTLQAIAAPTWREVIFGRKRDPVKDDLEFEKAKRQWEEAVSESAAMETAVPREQESLITPPKPPSPPSLPVGQISEPTQPKTTTSRAVFY
ncbi:hypothetical protein FRB99_005061 [Tulasnella sp. 403]|nr:hypothetical protein FRB99_005061 [Tulasnella sp. 403]